ncbi:MAG TPA: ABC transporter permease [Gemmatimonadales bacterium]|jgi:putative ABC transport system permease protein|nr:ABC transporter permease [Gemmatimonadales bacterium]
MPLIEAFLLALESIRTSKLRSFFTLLGIIVSVGFLVAVVAIIQGMNSYVRDNLRSAMIGTNVFQVRRSPLSMGFLDDSVMREIAKRPIISKEDAEIVRRAFPDAEAVSLQSGWPTPTTDITYRGRTIGSVTILGVTPEYQLVQDYQFADGEPLAQPDVEERRQVVVVGSEVAEKLFDGPTFATGKRIRLGGKEMEIKGVIAKKGRVLGQSFDGFALMPISTFEAIYGRRLTTTISIKLPPGGHFPEAMARAEEAMRLAHRLRPTEVDDFSLDKADALVAFWTNLTGVLFTLIPAVVCIGIVVGGIVIMNIMLMSVNERTREIGIRKSLGARQRDIRRQFLVEAILLSSLGGIMGILGGGVLAFLISTVSPLPARVTPWSVGVALLLGAGTGIVFGVYPASRAARLDPITALRQE